MPIEKDTARKITRDILVSLLLYALPVLLMLLSFYFTGERPWKEKKQETAKSR
ncbi:hypothetical protein [Foetidibacter luteolus]|uniref:hypothetical protein n=1 Tax=Foetidibacter luteolus TaxID=2608880 RepID=UPI001A986AE9|nr:hypothetical protein [Foetidibacter luteolus]